MSLPDSRDAARAHDGSGGSDERHAEYVRRLGERRAALTVEDQRHFKIGNLRIAVFLLTVAMFFAAFIGQSFSGWWLLLPVAVLIVIGRQLERAEARIARLQRAVAFYDRGLARLEHRWIGAGDDGAEFGDADHLYATDLDVLGGGSLFQLLSVARTGRGLETLAAWLLTRAPIDTIAARQQSVRELAARLDLREEMAVSGNRSTERGSADALVAWGARPSQHVTSSSRAGAGLLSALGLGAVVAGVTALFANFGIIVIAQSTADSLETYFFVVAAACFAIHGMARRWTEPILADVFRAERDLGLLADVLASLERSTFTSPYLVTLRQTLVTTGLPASARIARLKLYAALLAARRNELMKIVGPLLLWDVHLAFAVEAWRERSGQSIADWLRAVGEFEAVASLAGFAWERPDAAFPDIAADGPFYEAAGIHHPLLPVGRAVPNDVHLSPAHQVMVVSGSNMSGKSTLLRTIGINAVLAQAGAPVCARTLRLSPLVVGASIRIQDSLQEGTSRFYAEISRLSEIMSASRGPVPVLFLIDEFLHGTNSHDRLIGAEAVVRGLADHGAIGLITTHDLALTRMVDALGSRASNVHFQDYLEGGRMRFDYRMQPGVVQHSNALALMRSVGLDV